MFKHCCPVQALIWLHLGTGCSVQWQFPRVQEPLCQYNKTASKELEKRVQTMKCKTCLVGECVKMPHLYHKISYAPNLKCILPVLLASATWYVKVQFLSNKLPYTQTRKRTRCYGSDAANKEIFIRPILNCMRAGAVCVPQFNILSAHIKSQP